MSESKSMRKVLIYGALTLWALVIAVGASLLTAGHEIVFTAPRSTFETAMRDLQQKQGATKDWFVLHVIAEDCRCSADALQHVLARGIQSDRQEYIFFVGKEMPADLKASHFKSQLNDAGTMFREYGVESAPLLAIMSPDGELVFKGGYSKTRTSPVIEDTVIASAMRGEELPSLPFFGCAMTDELKNKVDPLGLKYN